MSAIFIGYWVTAILAASGQIGVLVMISPAMLCIVLAISILRSRINGRWLAELSP